MLECILSAKQFLIRILKIYIQNLHIIYNYIQPKKEGRNLFYTQSTITGYILAKDILSEHNENQGGKKQDLKKKKLKNNNGIHAWKKKVSQAAYSRTCISPPYCFMYSSTSGSTMEKHVLGKIFSSFTPSSGTTWPRPVYTNTAQYKMQQHFTTKTMQYDFV